MPACPRIEHVFVYDQEVSGSESYVELNNARLAYLAAVAKLTEATNNFYAAHVPLAPDNRYRLPPWSPHQIRAVVAVRDAWAAVVATRRTYELLVRKGEAPF